MIIQQLLETPSDTELAEEFDQIHIVYEIPIALEEHIGVYPTDAEIMRWQTVGDVLAWIERQAV